MAAEIAREARRRRILERGTDRLAVITGRARSLPPSTASPPPPKREGGEGVELPVSDTVHPAGHSLVTDYELPKSEPSSATLRDTIDRSSGPEILAELKKSDESVDTMRHNNENTEPAAAYSSYDQVLRPAAQREKRQTHGMFTDKKISSSISASENVRIICAAAIALLSVLSYRRYPAGGEATGSLVSFRPLYLVLLTDSFLVFGTLLTTDWKGKDVANAERTGPEGDDWMDQMGKALEVALASQKLVSAAFIDCCLCAVIIICGISFP